MMRISHVLSFAVLGCAVSVSSPNAQSGVGYREYQFGGSLASVAALAGVSPLAVRNIHQRPAILQELPWRRSYSLSPLPVDPVQAMVFSFYNDQLFKLVIEYDRDRTEGMNNADMIQALSDVYGVASTPLTKAERAAAPRDNESGVEVARWGQAEQSVVLYRATYPPAFRLVVTSPRLDTLARAAETQARQRDEREAPQREIVRQQQEAAAARAAEDKARAANKATFRP
jgi:hypothetical protein